MVRRTLPCATESTAMRTMLPITRTTPWKSQLMTWMTRMTISMSRICTLGALGSVRVQFALFWPAATLISTRKKKTKTKTSDVDHENGFARVRKGVLTTRDSFSMHASILTGRFGADSMREQHHLQYPKNIPIIYCLARKHAVSINAAHPLRFITITYSLCLQPLPLTSAHT
jgi:hypothetical protein